MSRAPDIEKALMHLSAAGVEADLGMASATWERGEQPDRGWWGFRNAAEAIRRAERELERGQRDHERHQRAATSHDLPEASP